MQIVIQIKGGLIDNILTDAPAEVLVLNHDAELPGIDDDPEETVIDFEGNEVICDQFFPEIIPLRVNYFFALHGVAMND